MRLHRQQSSYFEQSFQDSAKPACLDTSELRGTAMIRTPRAEIDKHCRITPVSILQSIVYCKVHRAGLH
jgi:hypothetical protein